ncbi:MAG: large-conductance mechanosensitive channel protein MscL [Eubacteriales bacterium]|nr:large-conductance mechanosensitive channel protein MscL [Eubacteriales bacterium]MDD4566257.1 large-conductance mechanosensitive channel protein MscL [Eubacteriales bacterium]
MKKKGASFIAEFKEFISRGNVIDLAVGLMIGSAFTSIVSSLVNDIVMPIIGWIFGGVNFTELKYVITPLSETTEEAAIYYGVFIQSVVDFFLIALAIFIAVKVINSFRRKKEEEEEQASPEPSEEVLILREIRDAISSKQQGENRTL